MAKIQQATETRDDDEPVVDTSVAPVALKKPRAKLNATATRTTRAKPVAKQTGLDDVSDDEDEDAVDELVALAGSTTSRVKGSAIKSSTVGGKAAKKRLRIDESNVDDEPASDMSVAPVALKKPRTKPNATRTKQTIRSDIDRFTVNDLAGAVEDSWRLIARVVARRPPSRWTSMWGGGQKFKFHLVDSNGEMINATVFNRGVEVFDRVIKPGMTFAFAGGRVKATNAAYSSDKWELSFDERASIVETTSILQVSAQYTSIEGVLECPIGSKVSVMGAIAVVGELKTITTKKGTSCAKRDFLIVDETMRKIVCTCWGDEAEDDITALVGKPVLVKNAELGEYQGIRSLNLTPSSTTLFDPDLVEAADIERWFTEGHDLSLYSFV